jgi:hypothetical protein
MNPINQDEIISILEEDRAKLVLEDYFNTKLIKTDKYHPMDFIDEQSNYYEIKSRRNNYNRYNTTMITTNKIKFCKRDSTKQYYFVFCFSDGDYIYHYNSKDYFEFGLGGRTDRGIDEIKQYCYIPINLLKKIEINI